jgi:hypothetical protein
MSKTKVWMEINDEETWTLEIEIQCDILYLGYSFSNHKEITWKEWKKLCSGKKCDSRVISCDGEGNYEMEINSLELSSQTTRILIRDPTFPAKLKKVINEARREGFVFK